MLLANTNKELAIKYHKIIPKFYAFLFKNNSAYKFIYNINEINSSPVYKAQIKKVIHSVLDDKSIAGDISFIDNLIINSRIEEFINNAFFWDQTIEGAKYWFHLNIDWKLHFYHLQDTTLIEV